MSVTKAQVCTSQTLALLAVLPLPYLIIPDIVIPDIIVLYAVMLDIIISYSSKIKSQIQRPVALVLIISRYLIATYFFIAASSPLLTHLLF